MLTNSHRKTERSSMGPQEAMFKIITIGDSGTGKSCLIKRYCSNTFDKAQKPTIGVQFVSKKIDINEDHKVKICIWDTAGQESFRSIAKTFYRNASAVILVYNIANKRSFQSLKEWIQQARECSPQNSIYILMGTHKDLQNQRQVSQQQARKFVYKQKIAMFFQTSAKTSQNISTAFEQMAKQLFINQFQTQKEDQGLQTQKFDLSIQQPRMFSCC